MAKGTRSDHSLLIFLKHPTGGKPLEDNLLQRDGWTGRSPVLLNGAGAGDWFAGEGLMINPAASWLLHPADHVTVLLKQLP